MNMTSASKNQDAVFSPIMVDTPGLQKLLQCGRESAVKVGTEAEARVNIGRRVLWNVSKIHKYLDSISG